MRFAISYSTPFLGVDPDLSFVAAATRSLLLGTGVLLLPYPMHWSTPGGARSTSRQQDALPALADRSGLGRS